MLRTVRQLVLWTHPRGSWQYDILAIAILAFIFLTPGEIFHDQPRTTSLRSIDALSEDSEVMLFWAEPFVVDDIDVEDRDEELNSLLRQRTGRRLTVIDVHPSIDEKGEVRAYLIYARP
ncbi:MAG: hypothetical protein CMN58_05760 [Solibacterales bacterium]|nr:hypothetical protein [Bryobacterales bacterium]|tara:strand:+ start:15669 stop:16025 length:357 start_codon:yes stop_codon:yes gene_type:complete